MGDEPEGPPGMATRQDCQLCHPLRSGNGRAGGCSLILLARSACSLIRLMWLPIDATGPRATGGGKQYWRRSFISIFGWCQSFEVNENTIQVWTFWFMSDSVSNACLDVDNRSVVLRLVSRSGQCVHVPMEKPR
jgi:hypothetical protein